MSSVAESVWPKGSADGLWPSLARVEKLFPSALGQVSNSTLGDPILKMGILAGNVADMS